MLRVSGGGLMLQLQRRQAWRLYIPGYALNCRDAMLRVSGGGLMLPLQRRQAWRLYNSIIAGTIA